MAGRDLDWDALADASHPRLGACRWPPAGTKAAARQRAAAEAREGLLQVRASADGRLTDIN
jgi:hypothetical protein